MHIHVATYRMGKPYISFFTSVFINVIKELSSAGTTITLLYRKLKLITTVKLARGNVTVTLMQEIRCEIILTGNF